MPFDRFEIDFFNLFNLNTHVIIVFQKKQLE